jgi:hypothetical protein
MTSGVSGELQLKASSITNGSDLSDVKRPAGGVARFSFPVTTAREGAWWPVSKVFRKFLVADLILAFN